MTQGIQKQIGILPTIEPEGHLIQVSRENPWEPKVCTDSACPVVGLHNTDECIYYIEEDRPAHGEIA
jgi:hypothetical protein